MRREIAFRAAVGTLYGVAAVACLVLLRGVETFWDVLAIVVGSAGLAGLIHWLALRVYESRYRRRVVEQ
ncbi:hypothetical protein [Nocardioides sp. L-11A]|uniref:hypothetical protein n=1 Tax=Nocardioides sp. L-11A TaxID=3043848 RepID=UPI00249AB081|nr:hypothetical protein QJ852_04230 [Nocardioides sp. L-11A]